MCRKFLKIGPVIAVVRVRPKRFENIFRPALVRFLLEDSGIYIIFRWKATEQQSFVDARFCCNLASLGAFESVSREHTYRRSKQLRPAQISRHPLEAWTLLTVICVCLPWHVKSVSTYYRPTDDNDDFTYEMR